MRIIGGQFRSRVLATFEGEEIRPTADRVKESLFNILAYQIYGARVLDLFCGSGALGLESLSRGAEEVVFNDLSKDSLAVLKKNMDKLGVKARVYNGDYKATLSALTGGFDIVFLDPPYRFDYAESALEIIGERKLLKKNGVIVYEWDKPFTKEVPFGFYKADERKYGKTYLTFFKRTEDREE